MTHMPLRELFAMYKVGGRIGAAVHSEYGHRMRNAVSDTSLVNIEVHIHGTEQRRLAWGGRDPELIYHDNGDTEVIIALIISTSLNIRDLDYFNRSLLFHEATFG
jgi:hypothetical protein